jgi:hypothetical protein
MKREQFIKDADPRAHGHFQKWMKNAEVREEMARPNPVRKAKAAKSAARKRTPA